MSLACLRTLSRFLCGCVPSSYSSLDSSSAGSRSTTGIGSSRFAKTSAVNSSILSPSSRFQNHRLREAGLRGSCRFSFVSKCYHDARIFYRTACSSLHQTSVLNTCLVIPFKTKGSLNREVLIHPKLSPEGINQNHVLSAFQMAVQQH